MADLLGHSKTRLNIPWRADPRSGDARLSHTKPLLLLQQRGFRECTAHLIDQAWHVIFNCASQNKEVPSLCSRKGLKFQGGFRESFHQHLFQVGLVKYPEMVRDLVIQTPLSPAPTPPIRTARIRGTPRVPLYTFRHKTRRGMWMSHIRPIR